MGTFDATKTDTDKNGAMLMGPKTTGTNFKNKQKASRIDCPFVMLLRNTMLLCSYEVIMTPGVPLNHRNHKDYNKKEIIFLIIFLSLNKSGENKGLTYL